MSLTENLLKNSNNKFASKLNDSSLMSKDEEFIPTDIPILNVALSGKIYNGLTSGVTTIAGESKRFKTLFGLYMISAFQKKYKDGVCIFYDTEFGTPPNYLSNYDLDLNRIIHIPISDVEELKHETMKQLDYLKNQKEKSNVMIFVDSIGNLASRKEIDDALEGNTKADMTRAKALKSYFRMITVPLKLLTIPLVCINHVYKSQSFIPTDVVSGGTGIYYTSGNVWIIGRRQEKDGKDVTGYEFIINVEKSRFVKEKSKLPIKVHWDTGIQKYSGLSDLAEEFNIIEKIKIGRLGGYKFNDIEVSEIDIDNSKEFWDVVFEKTDFSKKIEEKYSI